jgi:hypothetical protein
LNQHRRSKASSLLNNDVGAGQNAVAEDLLCSRRKIRKLDWTPRSLLCRNDAGDDCIAIAKLDGLSRAQPSFELPGIPKLADVYVRHLQIVTHDVTHVNEQKSEEERAAKGKVLHNFIQGLRQEMTCESSSAQHLRTSGQRGKLCSSRIGSVPAHDLSFNNRLEEPLWRRTSSRLSRSRSKWPSGARFQAFSWEQV